MPDDATAHDPPTNSKKVTVSLSISVPLRDTIVQIAEQEETSFSRIVCEQMLQAISANARWLDIYGAMKDKFDKEKHDDQSS